MPDICVVGAGAAGIVISHSLANLGLRVLLLEAGDDSPTSDQSPYLSDISGNFHAGLQDGRYRGLGGTTTKWGGQILELDEYDFLERSWVPMSGWPLKKSELASYYDRALQTIGLGDSIRADEAVWASVGLSSPAMTSMESYLTRWCPQPNFAKLFYETLVRPDIEVWMRANVVRLNLVSGIVRSLVCVGGDGVTTEVVAEKFVFCLGGIESNRFFLQAIPETTPESMPWNGSGLLGMNFQDHIAAQAGVLTVVNTHKFRREFENFFISGLKYQPKWKLRFAIQESNCLLNIAGTLNEVGNENVSINRLKHAARLMVARKFKQLEMGDVISVMRHLPNAVAFALHLLATKRGRLSSSGKFSLRVHCEQEPGSQSRITLSESRDVYGMKRANLTWRISQNELRTMKFFARAAQSEVARWGSMTLDRWVTEESSALLAESRCFEDSNHHMGGMRMARQPSDGVVDTNLRLFGTTNCYVCSAAVFPTSGFSNPTHTVLALAVRLADHLSGARTDV